MLQKKCCFSNCSRRLDTDYNQFSTTNPHAEGTSMSNSTIKQGSNIVLCRRLLLINIEDETSYEDIRYGFGTLKVHTFNLGKSQEHPCGIG